jgi:hypothetical protein
MAANAVWPSGENRDHRATRIPQPKQVAAVKIVANQNKFGGNSRSILAANSSGVSCFSPQALAVSGKNSQAIKAVQST